MPTKQDKINLFKSIFIGRIDAYGQGKGQCVKSVLSDIVINEHLAGKTRIGQYPLSMDCLNGQGCYWGCIDFDDNGIENCRQIQARLNSLDISSYAEKSSGVSHPNGAHLWVFFAEPIAAINVKTLLTYALDDLPGEINPKQLIISENEFGNYVNLPLFGKDVPNGKTVFLDPSNSFQPYPDQWEFLKIIVKVTSQQMQDLLETEELKISPIALLSDELKKISQTAQPAEAKHDYQKLMDGSELVNNSRTETLTVLAGHWYTSQIPLDEALAMGKLWDKNHELDNDKLYKTLLPKGGKVEYTIRDIYKRNDKKDEYEVKDKVADLVQSGKMLNLTDMGNGERLIKKFGENLRFCAPQNTWYCWNEKQWKADDKKVVHSLAKITARNIMQEAKASNDDKLKKAIKKHSLASESNNRIDAMMNMATSEKGIPILLDDMDTDPFLFNCANGTIDLKTGNLLAHNRSQLISKISLVKYDPDARDPLWYDFLETSTQGNGDLQEFLQIISGYSLSGSTKEEKMFFIYGPSATGKSSFIEAIKAVLGDYGKTADFETFLKKKFDAGIRSDIADLAGARFVTSIEVEQGKHLAEAVFKMLLGGDTVKARFLYQNYFEFIPVMKLWLVANHAPEIDASDDAIWRRILRVGFTNIIPADKRDSTVKSRLRDVNDIGPTILSWAVEGCLKWLKNGLVIPECVVKSTAEYRLDMEYLGLFIDECCFKNTTAKISKSALYKKYENWCKEYGETIDTKRTFGRKLKETYPMIKEYKGKDTKDRVIWFWVGIGLIADTGENAENDPELDNVIEDSSDGF